MHQVLVVAFRIVSCIMWDPDPSPGMEPRLPVSGTQSLSHWTTSEVPGHCYEHCVSYVLKARRLLAGNREPGAQPSPEHGLGLAHMSVSMPFSGLIWVSASSRKLSTQAEYMKNRNSFFSLRLWKWSYPASRQVIWIVKYQETVMSPKYGGINCKEVLLKHWMWMEFVWKNIQTLT